MNYLRHKYMALMRGVNFRGYLRKASGYPLTLTDCMDSDIVSLSVAGNAVQDGTPSPDAPVEVVGVGDKTEPYGYRVPIECRGKNLFDKNKYKNIYDYVSDIAPYYYCVPIKLMPKTKYTVSFKRYNWDGKGHHRLMIRDFGGSNVAMYLAHSSNPYEESIKHTYTTGEDGLLYVATYSSDIVTQSDLDFIWEHCDVQIEEGNTATAYEPYRHDSVSIYTDTPLYGIDDYADSITLDFANRKAVRTDMVKKELVAAEGVYEVYDDVVRFYHLISPVSYKGARMISDGLACYPENTAGWTSNAENMFMHHNYSHIFYFSLNKTRINAEDTDTASQLVEKANAYLADNPITVYYKLGTPITTDISDKIDWDSLSLTIGRGTNIITSTATVQPAGMTAEYYSTKET